jgi:hypothetical protein
MLLVNTLEWFAGDSGNREAAGQLTGRSLRIPVTTGSDGSSETGAQSAGATAAPIEATVTDPGGRQRRVPIHDGEALLDAGRAGFYTLRSGEDGDSIVVAVNLDAAATSDLRRPATLRLAGQEIGRPPPSALGLRRGIWVYLVLAACLLSLIEWFTYNRRMTV